MADEQIGFIVEYEDGRNANMYVGRWEIKAGDHVLRFIAGVRQYQGVLPEGRIKSIKRSSQVMALTNSPSMTRNERRSCRREEAIGDEHGDDESDALLMGYLDSLAVDAQADYLRRGRAHQDLSEHELAEQWVAAFRAMVLPAADEQKHRIESDYSAEFELRGMEPPDDLVKDDMEHYLAYVADKLEAMKRDDPEGWDRLVLELGKDIRDYKPAKQDAH